MESKSKIIEKLRNSDNITSYLSQSVFENNLRESLDNPKTTYIFNMDVNKGFNRNKNIDFLKSNIFHTNTINNPEYDIVNCNKNNSLISHKYRKNQTTIETNKKSSNNKESSIQNKPCIRLQTTIDKINPKSEKKKNMIEKFYEPEYKSNITEFRKKHLDFLYKGNSLGYNNHKIDFYNKKTNPIIAMKSNDPNACNSDNDLKEFSNNHKRFNNIDFSTFYRKNDNISKKINCKALKNTNSKQMDELLVKSKNDKYFNKPNEAKINNQKSTIISDSIRENLSGKKYFKPKHILSFGINSSNK